MDARRLCILASLRCARCLVAAPFVHVGHAGRAAGRDRHRQGDWSGADPAPRRSCRPPIAALSAAEGATMAKATDTRSGTTAKAATKRTRSAAETEKIRVALAERRDELQREYDETLSEIAELQRERLTD